MPIIVPKDLAIKMDDIRNRVIHQCTFCTDWGISSKIISNMSASQSSHSFFLLHKHVCLQGESVLSISFPALGTPDFTDPPTKANPEDVDAAGSMFWPLQAVYLGHPRLPYSFCKSKISQLCSDSRICRRTFAAEEARRWQSMCPFSRTKTPRVLML